MFVRDILLLKVLYILMERNIFILLKIENCYYKVKIALMDIALMTFGLQLFIAS